MKNELKQFQFGNLELQVLLLDGEVWYLAQNVATILEYNQTSDMTKRLDSDEKRNYPIRHENGNYTNQTLINEFGMYEAILGSKKKEAKKFRRWLKREVLPEIRRTGSYKSEGEDALPPVIHPRLGYLIPSLPEDILLKGHRNTFAHLLIDLEYKAPIYIQSLTDLVNITFTGDRARHLRERYGILNTRRRTRKELDVNLRRAISTVEQTACSRIRQIPKERLCFDEMKRVVEETCLTIYTLYLNKGVDLIENIPRQRLDEEHNSRLFPDLVML